MAIVFKGPLPQLPATKTPLASSQCPLETARALQLLEPGETFLTAEEIYSRVSSLPRKQRSSLHRILGINALRKSQSQSQFRFVMMGGTLVIADLLFLSWFTQLLHQPPLSWAVNIALVVGIAAVAVFQGAHNALSDAASEKMFVTLLSQRSTEQLEMLLNAPAGNDGPLGKTSHLWIEREITRRRSEGAVEGRLINLLLERSENSEGIEL